MLVTEIITAFYLHVWLCLCVGFQETLEEMTDFMKIITLSYQ